MAKTRLVYHGMRLEHDDEGEVNAGGRKNCAQRIERCCLCWKLRLEQQLVVIGCRMIDNLCPRCCASSHLD